MRKRFGAAVLASCLAVTFVAAGVALAKGLPRVYKGKPVVTAEELLRFGRCPVAPAFVVSTFGKGGDSFMKIYTDCKNLLKPNGQLDRDLAAQYENNPFAPFSGELESLWRGAGKEQKKVPGPKRGTSVTASDEEVREVIFGGKWNPAPGK